MSDYPIITTVLERLTAAGVAEHCARRHLRYSRVHVDGEIVTEPYTAVSKDSRIAVSGEEV